MPRSIALKVSQSHEKIQGLLTLDLTFGSSVGQLSDFENC